MSKRITFDTDLCQGCGLCVDACPQKLITLDPEIINSKGYNPAQVLEQEKCRRCGICFQMCPHVVIEIDGEAE